ncbi:multidrug efflux MFS transporter [Weissella confusa]|uniref:multidrug efflux MFS transporter n=1 Tax=Weissella confusa TaxID=1583 RepID=UPI0018F19219|nr:multidrug efflux MFS transporter [Weissella confusa]MBJ7618020.1 multidrug efflux MFS transporter [Weissella confusa]MBJ7624481.1 multidrug efflux MFS transporter [Weissella confusa]MBJ7657935.1 multidrug efflux MFS transporter [Weissella confusa]MBJ7665755.1 multidrug efflux MFS transporter [Weissella confusa]MBJ7676018.1 multidrug efflux MFS transporter [Weissella confusa]
MIQRRLSGLPTWQRNLYVLWFGVFMTGIGFSEVMPFLSLYVDTLGHFTKNQLTFYSGAAFAITFLMTAIVSPFWGKLADSKGRKLMLLRASLGMAIVFLLMGVAQNIWQLIFLRALQGLFGGFISNANAMIATQTPKERSGYALGLLVTGVTGGNLLGPFLGGVLASLVSYRISFVITGIIFLLVFTLTLTMVKEEFTPIERGASPSRKEVFQMLKFPKLTIVLFTTTLIIQMVNQSISPIVALFVRELNHGAPSTTFLAGLVAAMPGIATMIAAPRFGRIGDRIGTNRMIMIGFALAFIFMLPTGFVTAVWQLVILRFMIGISDATMLPAVQTMLSKSTPREITSRIFAYNQSFQSLGAVAGPMLGTLVATYFDYNGIFMVSAALIVVNAIIFGTNTRFLRHTDDDVND